MWPCNSLIQRHEITTCLKPHQIYIVRSGVGSQQPLAMFSYIVQGCGMCNLKVSAWSVHLIKNTFIIKVKYPFSEPSLTQANIFNEWRYFLIYIKNIYHTSFYEVRTIAIGDQKVQAYINICFWLGITVLNLSYTNWIQNAIATVFSVFLWLILLFEGNFAQVENM